MRVLVLFYHRDLVFIFNCHNATCVIEKNEFPTVLDDHQKCLEGEGPILRKAHSTVSVCSVGQVCTLICKEVNVAFHSVVL